jgi:hypothetical protein
MAKRAESPADDSLDLMRKRYGVACDYWNPKFDKCREDIEFVTVPGAQWDSKLKSRRGDRPTYEFPKLEQHCQTVINEMRQSRPQGKVRGLEETDKGLAEIMQGIARNIESVSNADMAHDVAFAPAVQGGYGVFAIDTDYANQDDFDLDIFIDPIRDPFSVKFDPAANKIDRRDGRFCFVEETMPKDSFVREYPKADPNAVIGDDRYSHWRVERDQVRVCKYWYKQPTARELLAIQRPALTNPLTMQPAPKPPVEVVWRDAPGMDAETLAANGIEVVKSRQVESHKVMCRLTNGAEWLTDAHEFPSKFIPIIPVWGNLAMIDGEDHFKGMVRSNKDSQRLHNVHRTAMIEAVAKAPKAPFIAKPSWIKGFEEMWRRANSEDFGVMFIADDAPDGVMPQRTQQAEVPAALIQMSAMDEQDIKAGTGLYNPSLGAASGGASGRALQTQKISGQTATFNYIDNLVYAIRYQYEILVDMIPRVYDTQRVVRLLGEDGASKWKTLYEEVTDDNGQKHVVNDISKGKYDSTVTVGPSYATQRMEAADAFSTLVGQIGPVLPQVAPVLAYAAINNLDFPGADEVVNVVRAQLVKMGALPPKDGEEPPPQANPMEDPAFQANLEKLLSEIRKNNATAAKTEAETLTILPTAQANIAKTEADTGAKRIDTVGAIGGMAAPMMAPQFPDPMPLPNMQFPQ